MEKKSFYKRFISPQLTVIIIMAISFLVYHYSHMLKNYTLFQILSTSSGILIMLTLWFGTFYIYSLAYLRGASLFERIVACFIPAFLWATKESIIMAGIYSVPEAIYFYLSVVDQWLVSTMIAEMGISELLLRRAARKRGVVHKRGPAVAIIAIVIGIGNFLFTLLWDVGVNHFYIFMDGYRAIFCSGMM
ncbi:MAG: hypothetical protein JW984_07910 [Deltaproteobacteria bacterium]|uniref:Uncharacterized protein n=1 Tax=Candidatus Zymogenus saltonus TaxID=2844893 RepID=A0A9D8KFC8_9DELT|nr:hypothetical protein [Candidatus Zymogenus saltonus]